MSDKPIAERLQVKAERRLAVVGAPASIDEAIGVRDRRAPIETAQVVLLFVADRAGLDSLLPMSLARLLADAILWIAYPKLTSGLAGDLNRGVIHDLAPSFGLDTVAQIAIDADWSALRLKRTG